MGLLTIELRIDELIGQLSSGKAYEMSLLSNALEQLDSDVQAARKEEKIGVCQEMQDDINGQLEIDQVKEFYSVGATLRSRTGDLSDQQKIESKSTDLFISLVSALEDFIFEMVI